MSCFHSYYYLVCCVVWGLPGQQFPIGDLGSGKRNLVRSLLVHCSSPNFKKWTELQESPQERRPNPQNTEQRRQLFQLFSTFFRRSFIGKNGRAKPKPKQNPNRFKEKMPTISGDARLVNSAVCTDEVEREFMGLLGRIGSDEKMLNVYSNLVSALVQHKRTKPICALRVGRIKLESETLKVV